MRAAIRKVIAFDFGTEETPTAPAMESDLPAQALAGTALVVTGDAASRQWAPRWLKQAGFSVRVAAAPSEGMNLVGAINPDLVIVDAGFRNNDGNSLIVALRAAYGDQLAVLALCSNDVEAREARDADATEVVRKPYNWDVVARRSLNAVRIDSLQRELDATRQHLDELRLESRRAARAKGLKLGTDRTTQLPNAERFRSLLHKATTGRSGSQENLGLLIIGLDNFRIVNEAVGYENGNRLLAQFADRLRECLRDRKVIGGSHCGTVTAFGGRLGGARFGLVVSDSGSQQVLAAERAISEQLAEPFEVGGQSVYVTASIGAAIFPQDSTSVDVLLNCADSAMRKAQDAGTGFRIHSEQSDTSSQKLLTLDSMLREAVRHGDLELAFQPINDAATGAVVAAEALLRWNHAVEGPISPAEFVPIAEKSGLMNDIGKFVIRSACAQLRAWLDGGMQPIRMAVNLSLCQLLRGDVPTIVAQALEQNRIDPAMLELELSERGVLNRHPEVIEQVQRLKELGVRISIDDFGTGQAAIGYLKDLPIDVIKIDRSYVSGSRLTKREIALASGMVALAQGLDTTVIVEGVETAEQLARLRAWGSQEYQGFLCSPAVPGDEFLRQFG